MRFIITLLFLTLLFGNEITAQTATGDFMTAAKDISLEVYVLLILILFELIVIIFLSNSLLMALGYQKKLRDGQDTKTPGLFKRISSRVLNVDDDVLDLKHDYDGISELDNKTPQWWIYAFYFTIAFGVIYLYRTFVTESLPGQIVELKMENQQADMLKASYLSLSSGNVDENSVTVLGSDDIMKGGMTFTSNCVPCHGPSAEGNVVGPNLTDQYWLHKGSVKDIFTTIKYGYPEKGMKSWKDDFSPMQIAQLASYIISLQGTNPPNAKAPQGELYVEDGNLNSAPTDTLNK